MDLTGVLNRTPSGTSETRRTPSANMGRGDRGGGGPGLDQSTKEGQTGQDHEHLFCVIVHTGLFSWRRTTTTESRRGTPTARHRTRAARSKIASHTARLAFPWYHPQPSTHTRLQEGLDKMNCNHIHHKGSHERSSPSEVRRECHSCPHIRLRGRDPCLLCSRFQAIGLSTRLLSCASGGRVIVIVSDRHGQVRVGPVAVL